MKKRLCRIFACTYLYVMCLPAFASAAEQPTLVSGTLKLLNDATGWLLLLVPVSTACLAGWHLWVKSLSEGDPTQAAAHGHAAKKVVIAGIIIEGITSLVRALLSYYSG